MARKQERTRKHNKYAGLNEPQAILDYHGKGILTEDQIKNMAEEFLVECKNNGFSRVLIITGKGLHSKEGPVIGPLLSWYLHKIPYVKSAVTARRDRGGEGALEIFLQ